MKAILWKEWRENLRWGILALVALSIALAYTVFSTGVLSPNGQSDKCAAVWNAAYLVMTFGCPLIAVALGFAQVMPELRRDQWAFLMHRPVPWSVIFGGKAIIGISLSLAAAGIPFLLFVLWTASPGNVPAPFDARLALPGVASLLTIVPCYFAGMLTALRPAKWFGSRALALPAAIAAVLLTIILPEFLDVLVAEIIFGVILVAAAWGSFLTRGQYTGQPRPAKIGLGVTLFAGSLVAVIALAVLTGSLISALIPQSGNSYNYSYYSIQSSGHILRITETSIANIRTMIATDLNGKTVVVPTGNNRSYNENALSSASLLTPEKPQSSYDVSGSTAAYRNTGRLVVPLATGYDISGSVVWYYVPGERHALGYGQKSRRLVGFLGPTGFSRPSDENVPRFEAAYPLRQSWESANVFRFPQTVYWVDPETSTVSRIYEAKQTGDIQGACVTSGVNNYGPGILSQKAIVVAAADGFHASTTQGKPLFTTPREYDPAQYRNVNASMTPDGRHFFFRYSASPKARLPEYVTQVSSAGVVEKRSTLPALTENASTVLPPVSFGAFGLLAPPLPMLGLMSYLEIGHRLGDRSIDDMRQAFYAPYLAGVLHLAIVLSVLSGLLSAVLAWLIARRCVLSVRDRWLWAFGIFWLGPYGIFMLLALREWPVRVPCPNCGRKRSVQREHCEYCGAEFARPLPDGTEIFDRAENFDGAEVKEERVAG